MFSVTYTGMNVFPLCTGSVCPTNSGVIIERRDQVLSTYFSRARFMSSIRFASLGSTNGPFFNDRATLPPCAPPRGVRHADGWATDYFRRFTM